MPADPPPDDSGAPGGPPGGRGDLALVLPALAAAVAVGVAATGAGLLLPGAELGDAATLGARAGGVALAVAGLVALTTAWGRAARAPGRELVPVLLTAAAVMAGVTALTYGFSPAALTLPEGSTTTTVEPTTTTTEQVSTTTTTIELDEPDDPMWDPMLLLSVLVLAAVLALVIYALVLLLGVATVTGWWRPSAPPPPVVPAPPLDVAAAEAGLEASLDAVTADASPRDAIADAYARLLAALAEAGAGRRTQEAPHEHLDRVLGPLGVRSDPLHRLAGLFVLARFSQHPVTAAHRDDARDALREALADLRAARAAGTTGADEAVTP
jgi:hypothetical protein